MLSHPHLTRFPQQRPAPGTGTQYKWPGDTNGVACETVVDEVMRSCGGAVQGIRVGDGPLLNRQDDGFCFFDCGSWTQGPTKLTDGAAASTSASWRRAARACAARPPSARATWSTRPSSWRRKPERRLAKRESLRPRARPGSRRASRDAVDRGNEPAGRRRALPGGVSIACVDINGATDVVVRADDVSLTRSYDASGALVAISLHAPSPQDGAD